MEFVIPLDKDDLLKKRGREYHVGLLTSVKCVDQAINATKISLESKGPRFILDHFDDFFSVIVHGAKLDLPVTLRAYGRIVKTMEYLIDEMEKKFPNDENKSEYLCVNKMLAYLLSNLCCYLEDKTLSMGQLLTTVGKKKKNSNKSDERSDWETRREKILFLLYRWLQLPLQNLWNPPIVEESFVMLIADICYKILENDKDSRDKDITKTIFQILGTLVKRYIHGITCTIRILQLVKMHDVLAISLANGIVIMIMEYNCTGLIAEIAREIDQSNLEESEARNISIFLETIAIAKPNIIFGILENIMDYLSNENYSMRNCAIGVLGIIIQEALTGENMTKEEKKTRDKCFEKLTEHMLDINSYVRSKVFQTWQKLFFNMAVPTSRYGPLMANIIPHLEEKSAIVRKQTLVLLQALLNTCPFRTVMDKKVFLKKRAEHIDIIEKLRTKVVTDSLGGDEERFELWKELMPGIQAAIKKSVKSDDDDDDNDNEENDNDENEIDLVVEFETIRKLIVEKKFKNAVQYLKKINGKLNWADDLEDMNLDEKEHYYFFVLLKIFMESENNENKNEMKLAKSAEWKEQRDKMKTSQRIVDFFDNAILFSNELERAMPIIHNMLYADVATVAIEACTFLELAFNFKVPGANLGIQKALSQVFSREESVRNNVAVVYQKIYLNQVEKKNSDGNLISASLTAVNGLIELFSELKVGQSLALVQLISIWMENKNLTDEHIKIMWRKYTMKISDASFLDSRCSIALLTMVAEKNPKIIKSNLDIIIHVGLETFGKEDLLLARDSCRAILAMKEKSSESSKETTSNRFENNHRMFEEISFLLIDKLEKEFNDQYTSFATDAIHVIYSFANNPGKIIKVLLEKMFKTDEGNVNFGRKKFGKLIYVIGHIAIRHMIWLDTDVYKELKRRNAIVEATKGKKNMTIQTSSNTLSSSSVSALKARRSIFQKTNSSFIEDNGEDALGGATADDEDAEAIETELENNIVNGSGFLAKFVPIILDVCEHPEKFKNKETRIWAVLALSKMMTVSSIFCKKHLQLLVTILERSMEPEIRVNILYSLSDLIFRFPNEVEPWTSHMYGRLRDNDDLVRTTAVRVLSNLVKSEMIRVKGQMSEMAICIVDTNINIRIAAKKFFEELSQKKNILYNIMPDIISKLTSKDANIVEDDLHEILKNVLGLLQKERETDTLLDKICSRFPLSSSDRETRDIAFCLSLLQLGKKGLSRLIELLPMLKNKIHIREVQKALKEIVEVAKKKPNNKETCAQLEEEIQKFIQKNFDIDEENEDEDRRAMPPPIRPANKNKSSKRPASDSDNDHDDDDDDNSDKESQSISTKKNRKKVVINTPRSTRKATRPPEIENDNGEFATRTPRKKTATTTSRTPKSAKKGSSKTNNTDENSEAAKENVASTPRGRRPVTILKTHKSTSKKSLKLANSVENSENSVENLAVTPRTRGAVINSVTPPSTKKKSAQSNDANNVEDSPALTPNNRKSVNNSKTPRTTRKASENERTQEN